MLGGYASVLVSTLTYTDTGWEPKPVPAARGIGCAEIGHTPAQLPPPSRLHLPPSTSEAKEFVSTISFIYTERSTTCLSRCDADFELGMLEYDDSKPKLVVNRIIISSVKVKKKMAGCQSRYPLLPTFEV